MNVDPLRPPETDEEPWTAVELEPDSREWSRRTVLVCIVLAVIVVELAAWFGRNQS